MMMFRVIIIQIIFSLQIYAILSTITKYTSYFQSLAGGGLETDAEGDAHVAASGVRLDMTGGGDRAVYRSGDCVFGRRERHHGIKVEKQ